MVYATAVVLLQCRCDVANEQNFTFTLVKFVMSPPCRAVRVFRTKKRFNHACPWVLPCQFCRTRHHLFFFVQKSDPAD